MVASEAGELCLKSVALLCLRRVFVSGRSTLTRELPYIYIYIYIYIYYMTYTYIHIYICVCGCVGVCVCCVSIY
jgi:hypothetical protein